jgi:hypothetical protein
VDFVLGMKKKKPVLPEVGSTSVVLPGVISPVCVCVCARAHLGPSVPKET